MRLSELEAGEIAIIRELGNSSLSVKLLEMGCIPGERIKICRKAPNGGPIAVDVFGYILGLRQNEARMVEVERCL